LTTHGKVQRTKLITGSLTRARPKPPLEPLYVPKIRFDLDAGDERGQARGLMPDLLKLILRVLASLFKKSITNVAEFNFQYAQATAWLSGLDHAGTVGSDQSEPRLGVSCCGKFSEGNAPRLCFAQSISFPRPVVTLISGDQANAFLSFRISLM